jgi:hypothetical protein
MINSAFQRIGFSKVLPLRANSKQPVVTGAQGLVVAKTATTLTRTCPFSLKIEIDPHVYIRSK